MLRGIFYAEFDNTVGPKITFQAPDGYLSPQSFEQISGYVITGPKLSHEVVTLNACGKRIVCYPIRIENSKYYRNALIFNIGFVFDPETPTNNYILTLCKLASTIETLEHEVEFLSTAKTKAMLKCVFPTILSKLNSPPYECQLRIHPTNALSLKVCPEIGGVIPDVKAHQVPIQVVDIQTHVNSLWDLTLQQVIPFIDGSRYVRRIAEDAQVDVKLVIQSLRQLLYYGYIKMLDIFQFSNLYTSTPALRKLQTNAGLQAQCVHYVSNGTVRKAPDDDDAAAAAAKEDTARILGKVDGDDDAKDNWRVDEHGDDDLKKRRRDGGSKKQQKEQKQQVASSGVLSPYGNIKYEEREVLLSSSNVITPTISGIFRLYARLHQGEPIGKFCKEYNPFASGVDVRRLVVFGQIHGFVRRVRRYPLLIKSNPKKTLTTLDRMFNGTRSFDEISVALQVSFQTIISRVRSHEECVILLR
mmetsp:Transcript_4957/g.7660  ORF Transcript_4957/g.7660 Transcript_4957/m.7660 type:complete len:472 (-) Transcript_4957:150-1565(-)